MGLFLLQKSTLLVLIIGDGLLLQTQQLLCGTNALANCWQHREPRKSQRRSKCQNATLGCLGQNSQSKAPSSVYAFFCFATADDAHEIALPFLPLRSQHVLLQSPKVAV